MKLFSLIHRAKSNPAYLPHIDGLRAVAVLGVLFYHLDLRHISGGFIGVDVFFVISGYLITWHIRDAMKDGRFKFREFYGRRIRRLAPALVMTIAATLLAGFFILPPANFQSLADEAVFSVFSISNFLFWSQSGYFDADSSLKPLLHTWSLAVEEQFYLLWPLLLFFIKRENLAFCTVFFLGIFSLLAAEFFLRNDPALVFFMMPFRVIEFSMGGVLYWLAGRYALGRGYSEWLALLGLSLILASFFGFDKNTVFPGVSALLPCLGTALVIFYGANTRVGRLLSFPPILYVGLISYSVYLVHWPVIVLYKYLHITPLEAKDVLLLVCVTLLLASMLYFLIESPLRNKHIGLRLGSVSFSGVLSVFVVLVSVVALHVINNEGWSWRHEGHQLSLKEIEKGKSRRFKHLQTICSNAGWEACRDTYAEKGRRVLVTGDSHAVDGLNILYRAYPDYDYSSISLGGCPLLVPEDYGILSDSWGDKSKCIELNEKRLSKAYLQGFDVVVISIYFESYKPEHLWNALKLISERVDIPIIVFGNYIILEKDMADLMALRVDPRIVSSVVRNFALYEDELREGSQYGYSFISKKTLLCDGDGIRYCQIQFGAEPFSYDRHHLSLSAAQAAGENLKKQYADLADIFSD